MFCRQDVAKNEDEILPSGQTCVGRAQLCGQICQRKLQIAQGASLIMLPLVVQALIHTLGSKNTSIDDHSYRSTSIDNCE